MQKITLAVFDMAGTVVNEDNIVYKTLQKAINESGYDISLNYVLEHGAGKEKHQAIQDILKAEGNKTDLEFSISIFENFKKLLNQAYENLHVTSYSGVEELLDYLKKNGVKRALNTGYDTDTANLLLGKMGWELGSQYDVLVTSDDVTLGRPHPDMILKAMELLGVTDSEMVLKAGDSIIDIEEGKNAKCGITVGVTTGAQTFEQLASARPTFVLDELSRLKDLIAVV
ncbi:phosphonatase-like hydrolase [Cellulophaga baltica]|uniref:Phosphonatase-like hydrolase n=1 Tax=Cellulophaga baltica TaxID=76594 RepID=A0A1G7EDU8_9FLAO|nr:phosphonatase-like hydrolase [Cellulophaga baltica]SDE61824.1 phosphonatase-like hydrolase [Cellulophaga baltica]